jgi:Tol biopolymer transport system component
MGASQVAVLDLATGTWKTVIRGGRQAHYTTSGHLMYVAGTALMAVAFDVARLETRGTASGQALAPERTLVWVDRNGREEAISGAPERPYAVVRLSPDGPRVALEIDDGENDIWVWHLARHTLTRVTTDPGLDEDPVWSPDGLRLIFTSQADGAIGSLFRQAPDGSGTAERLTHDT